MSSTPQVHDAASALREARHLLGPHAVVRSVLTIGPRDSETTAQCAVGYMSGPGVAWSVVGKTWDEALSLVRRRKSGRP